MGLFTRVTEVSTKIFLMSEPVPFTVVAREAELPPGTTRKFLLRIEEVQEECFAVNYQGRIHAYVNKCLHVPMSLDWVDNQFFTEDRRFLLCATHGACYEPDTGECVSGPPCGKFLVSVPLRFEEGKILASVPGKESAA